MKKMGIKPKIVVILGPTASGKSDLAVELARRYNGEVISADSRQIYKGLNIGTGKITKKEMRGVKHHLLDVADPKKRFSAADFLELTNGLIRQMVNDGKLPIVCGGTGFYIDALVGDKQIPEVPPNPKLRKELENKSAEELFDMLQKLDPERAKTIEKQNPRRLVRAIEICHALGSVPKLRAKSLELKEKRYEVLKIGIAPMKKITHPNPSLTLREGQKGKGYILDEDKLKKRINRRIEKWFRQGLLKEVKDLHQKGLSWKRMSEIGLEYKLVANFLKSSKVSRVPIDTRQLKKEMAEKTWQYAKRQLTWFKRDKNIIWMGPKIGLIEKEVREFLAKQ